MDKFPKKKTPKVPGTCIFCGSSGLSHEHIWANWLRDYIPRDLASTIHTGQVAGTILHGNTRIPYNSTKTTEASGDPHSQRLRKVCKRCNSGWMSILQNRVKPILTPHLAGHWPDKCDSDQKILAAWATMFTMVVEFKHIPTVTVNQKQRQDFSLIQIPPENWHVWCGHYEGKFWKESKCFSHFGLVPSAFAAYPKDIPSVIRMPNQFNAQSTAITIGNLFLMTFSWVNDAVRNFDPLRFEIAHGLRTVWPVRNPVVVAPTVILDDFVADHVSRSFVPLDQRNSVRPAWLHG